MVRIFWHGNAPAIKGTMGPGREMNGFRTQFCNTGTSAIATRVHDHGMPVSQGELVRDMMDWFSGRADSPPPDERTVRRKVSAIWRELKLA